MGSSRKLHVVAYLLTILVGTSCLLQSHNPETSEFTLIRYFQLSKMICKHPSKELMASYDAKILDMMDDAYKVSYTDRDDAIRRTNNFIYEIVMEQKNVAEDEKLINAIDLMLPDCIKSKDFTDSRYDLRTFLREDLKSARELLDKIRSKLVKSELSTRHLGQILQNFYYHWIPLARLNKALQP